VRHFSPPTRRPWQFESEGRSMRRYFLSAAFVFALLVGSQVAAVSAAEDANPPNKARAAVANADDLVREALLAEADGNAAARSEKLRGSLAADQKSSAAHWLAGEIQIGDRWLSTDDAAQQAAQAGKMDEYRKQRDGRGNTLEDHIALARLCAKLGLKESERGQLIMALQIEPSNKEAVSKLGLIQKYGQCLTQQQYEQMKAAQKSANDSFARWIPAFQKLRRRYETNSGDSEELLKAVRALRDVDSIPSMEYVFGRADGPLAVAAVDALKEMPKQAATESLVRYVIFCDDKDARDGALTALRYRDRDSYLSLMIGSLKAPVQIQYTSMLIDGGSGVAQYQEGLFTDQVNVRFAVLPFFVPPKMVAQIRDAVVADTDRVNAVNSVRNARLFDALASISGQQIRDASEWWNWWFDENEYEPLEKATNVRVRASCFVQGTPVWTSTGPMAIEKIKPGEVVLSQNPVTGELAYKPVMATTVRRPSPTVEVKLGDSTIRGTRGHPYWVSGEGWRMAKELKAGQMLHSVNGPIRIEAASQVGEEQCFNLIVADFNSYFVGDAKVLVHDNTMRGPNTIRVPGLAEN
jgi:hypothetical protein